MKRVVDMQLYPQVEPRWDELGKTTFDDLKEACESLATRFAELSISSGLMLILNPGFLESEDNVARFREWRRSAKPPLVFGCLLNFRDVASGVLLETARELGFVTLKLYPYFQRIEDSEFDAVARLGRQAEALGMYITVCCSYGTRALDRHSGVRLAAFLSERVKCPVVMAHAGGARMLDAFLVAEAADNIFLDTSFSLPYYLGSSVEQDFGFAMRKLGTHRWMYGSDAPFVDLKGSLEAVLGFLDRHGFSESQIEDVLHRTAEGILNG